MYICSLNKTFPLKKHNATFSIYILPPHTSVISQNRDTRYHGFENRSVDLLDLYHGSGVDCEIIFF